MKISAEKQSMIPVYASRENKKRRMKLKTLEKNNRLARTPFKSTKKTITESPWKADSKKIQAAIKGTDNTITTDAGNKYTGS